MLSWMFILFFLLAVLMLVIALYLEDNPFWNITGTLISAVLWLILGLSQMQIEIPYTAIRTNDTIVTGYHTFTSPISPFITYFFILMFWICFIYLLAMVWDKWYNYKNWHGGY